MLTVLLSPYSYIPCRTNKFDFLLRTFSTGKKSDPPWRQKSTKMVGKPKVVKFLECMDDSIKTSEVLKRFLPESTKPLEVPSSFRKAEDVIKASDLLKDFIGMTISQTRSRNRPDLEKIKFHPKFTEPLPCPEKFPIAFSSLSKQTPAEFSKEDTFRKGTSVYKNDIYNEIEALELSAHLSKTSNKFEELILWTLEGKIWHYPIDNEQDWDTEQTTPFHEHVFLERFIDRKSEKPTPLAAFMELVCAGLAQNPYIGAQQKREHIQWFENYFSTKVSQIQSAVAEENRLSSSERKCEASD